MVSGTSLRVLRRRAGLSQADVAHAAGIPASVLSAYERGRRQPSFEAAGRIVGAMGFRIEFVRSLDPDRQSRLLLEVLALAEELPYRPRPLTRPDWGHLGLRTNEKSSNLRPEAVPDSLARVSTSEVS